MPYINCVTTQTLTKDKKESLKAQMGKLIETFPGKTEDWLFVRFSDGESLYFRGREMDKAAIVEFKLFGTQERKYKDAMTSEICELLKKETSIEPESVFVVYYEIENGNWGWNGALF